MGSIDAEGKKYLSNNQFFADAFNFLLYNGEGVIKPDELRELDTTELSIPYGNNARVPVQRYRDILKIWNAMMDNNAIYVILGSEIQDRVHYGMPVKDGLYDMIGYSKQIAEIKRSYMKEKDRVHEEGELIAEEGNIRIKLTSEEFLSGLRKGDKLIPIITAVIYLREQPWDGPKSLFDILEVRDKRLYRFLNDYKLNLISPADMDDAEFEKFQTKLGFTMKLIKHQSEDAAEIIMQTNHRKFSPETAYFLKSAIKLELEFEEEAGGIDMCKSLEKKEKKDRIIGAIQGMQMAGVTETDIFSMIMEKYDVTKEYVLALIKSQVA